jgi:hypothetical protein
MGRKEKLMTMIRRGWSLIREGRTLEHIEVREKHLR